MSDMYGAGPGSSPAAAGDDAGAVDTAKHEASEVKDTAAAEAGRVARTGKAEASAVADEAASQAKDLYAQTKTELSEQATVQQERLAGGLRSLGDELSTMADGVEGPGLGADLVREASTRLSGVASWLGDRDPAALLEDIMAYARRKPGTFIAIAAVAGLVAGRLVRALGDNAADRKDGDRNDDLRENDAVSTAAIDLRAPVARPVGQAAPGEVGATPVYDQSRAAWADADEDGR